MHTENEAVALRWHGDIFERDQYDVLEEICTPDFVWHNDAFPPETRTPAGTKELARALRAGFSDYRLSHVEGIDTIVTDDKVVTFWRFVGTHDGEFMGTPATGGVHRRRRLRDARRQDRRALPGVQHAGLPAADRRAAGRLSECASGGCERTRCIEICVAAATIEPTF